LNASSLFLFLVDLELDLGGVDGAEDLLRDLPGLVEDAARERRPEDRGELGKDLEDERNERE
jgi:hypothetical protein